MELTSYSEDFVQIYAISSDILCNIDCGDLDAVLADMTDDVTMAIGEDKATGAAEVRGAIQASLAEDGMSRHMLTNLRVKALDYKSLKVCSTVLVTVDRPDRRAVTTCEYEDVFVRENDRLKLSERVMSVASSLVL